MASTLVAQNGLIQSSLSPTGIFTTLRVVEFDQFDLGGWGEPLLALMRQLHLVETLHIEGFFSNHFSFDKQKFSALAAEEASFKQGIPTSLKHLKIGTYTCERKFAVASVWSNWSWSNLESFEFSGGLFVGIPTEMLRFVATSCPGCTHFTSSKTMLTNHSAETLPTVTHVGVTMRSLEELFFSFPNATTSRQP